MMVSIDNTDIFVGQGSIAWEKGKRNLVLLHGAAMDRTAWVLLARYFARHGYNVVSPDFPAHGASGGEVLGSIENQADFVWRLLDVLQSEYGLPDTPIVMGGHSMGALVAGEACGARPDKVEHLLVFGSGYPMPVGQPLLDAAKANEQAAVDMITIYSHCFESQLGHNHVAGISVQNSAMALLERSAPGVLYSDLQACNDYTGLESAAEKFGPGKATVITGDGDRMTPMKMSMNFATLFSADVTVLNNCGHMVMAEQPEQTLQAARKVLL